MKQLSQRAVNRTKLELLDFNRTAAKQNHKASSLLVASTVAHSIPL